MYYNPKTKQAILDQELKALLNVSFPEGREQIQDWLLVRDNPPLMEGKISIKSSIEMQDGIPVQTYVFEDASAEDLEPSSTSQDATQDRLKEITDQFALVDGAIMDLAAMISNLQVYCTNAVEEMKKASK
jgi:hypothetical protein